MPVQEVVDVEGAESLAIRYGERYRGYYLFKTFKHTESYPLKWKELTYRFKVYEYRVRFIMPPRLEFNGGEISYTIDERMFGMFRFPRDTEGNFTNPLILNDLMKRIDKLTQADLDGLLKIPHPLVFHAYKVPQHWFEFFDISPSDYAEIEGLTSKEHVEFLRETHTKVIDNRVQHILDKVSKTPNNLLILQNVLNHQWSNYDEVSFATEGLIHIE